MKKSCENEGNGFPLSLSWMVLSLSLSLTCHQLLKVIIYPLAIKAHNVLELVHQKDALLSGAARSSSFPL